MNIQSTKNGTERVLALKGRLDTISAPVLEAALKDALSGVETLVLDFEKLEYISSAGLRVLLVAKKVMQQRGGMKLLHVNETIMDIFEVTGFTDFLTIE